MSLKLLLVIEIDQDKVGESSMQRQDLPLGLLAKASIPVLLIIAKDWICKQIGY